MFNMVSSGHNYYYLLFMFGFEFKAVYQTSFEFWAYLVMFTIASNMFSCHKVIEKFVAEVIDS